VFFDNGYRPPPPTKAPAEKKTSAKKTSTPPSKSTAKSPRGVAAKPPAGAATLESLKFIILVKRTPSAVSNKEEPLDPNAK
jgi:hypothetical protein